MRKGNDSTSPDSSDISRSSSAPERSNGSDLDNIRQRAYELYEMRMNSNSPGDPISDWVKAEEQVRNELGQRNDVFTS